MGGVFLGEELDQLGFDRPLVVESQPLDEFVDGLFGLGDLPYAVNHQLDFCGAVDEIVKIG